jgi:hypothetical protein
MRKYLFPLIALTLLTSCIGAGVISDLENRGENKFPKLVGIDLFGEERAVPSTFTGDLNLVTIGFKREHQNNINEWIKVANVIMADNRDISFYELPIIYEINMPYRFWINNGMRSGVKDPAARQNTITIYTERKKFTELMNMKTDRIYTLLLDQDGVIIWRAEGDVSAQKTAELQRVINGR